MDDNKFFTPHTVLFLLVALFVLLHITHLTFQPDMRDDLRQADRLFFQKRFYAARQHYQLLLTQFPEQPELLLRMGMLFTIRNQKDLAEPMFYRAMRAGLKSNMHDLCIFYISHILRERAQEEEASRIWQAASPSSLLQGIQLVQQAEWNLNHGKDESAKKDYLAAVQSGIPSEWLSFIAYRLALIEAANDPDSALTNLETFFAQYVAWNNKMHRLPHSLFSSPEPVEPFIAPFLPNINRDAGQLLAILRTSHPHRTQLAGQFYLDRGMYDLAQMQFDRVASGNNVDPGIIAYAAYSQWRAGKIQAGQQQLALLVDQHPDKPHIRLLLVMIFLAQNNMQAAQSHIETLMKKYPQIPDVYLARASLHRLQSEYQQASKDYQQALKLATEEQRGQYASLAVDFYLETNYNLCTSGLFAAQYAAKKLPDISNAWKKLAAIHYYCGNIAEAVTTARTALAYEADAETMFYLGASLATLGDRDGARTALIDAADMSPASPWRKRAEEKLYELR